MLELYFYPSPNGMKVAIALEELGCEYIIRPVNIGAGDQFDPAYLKINPNNKIPSLVDTDRGITLFESGAILIYLAEDDGRFLPSDPEGRFRVLQWLFWQVGGLGPMGGQAHHFRAFATEKVPYGIRRYTDEMNRLYGVMEGQLKEREFLAGDYSVADMACWPWIAPHERQGQDLDDFPSVKRWFQAIEARPAVQRAMALGNEKHVDREAYRYLYGQTAERVIRHSEERGTSHD